MTVRSGAKTPFEKVSFVGRNRNKGRFGFERFRGRYRKNGLEMKLCGFFSCFSHCFERIIPEKYLLLRYCRKSVLRIRRRTERCFPGSIRYCPSQKERFFRTCTDDGDERNRVGTFDSVRSVLFRIGRERPSPIDIKSTLFRAFLRFWRACRSSWFPGSMSEPIPIPRGRSCHPSNWANFGLCFP